MPSWLIVQMRNTKHFNLLWKKWARICMFLKRIWFIHCIVSIHCSLTCLKASQPISSSPPLAFITVVIRLGIGLYNFSNAFGGTLYKPSHTRFHISLTLLSCQPKVTVTSCFVYKVIRDLESIDHLCINPIRRIGLIRKWSIDSH